MGYGFVALPMAFFLLFFIFPIGYAFYISRYDWQIFKGPFVGWDNYRDALPRQRLLAATRCATRSSTRRSSCLCRWRSVLRSRSSSTRRSGFGRSSAPRSTSRRLHRRPRSSRSRRTSSRPTASSTRSCDHLGYHHNNAWFAQQSTALPSIIGLNAWTTSGTMMIFYLAALQAIPTDVYEAAAIDGAGAWRTFRKITFPLLKPAHFFVAVVSIIGALQMFDQSFHRRRHVRRAELLDADGGALPLQPGDRATSSSGTRAAVGARPLRFHLHGHVDPATPLRQGRGRLMARKSVPPVPRGRRRASSRSRGWPRRDRRRRRAFPGRERADRIRTVVAYIVMFTVARCSSRSRSSGASRRRSGRSPTRSPVSRCLPQSLDDESATTRCSTPSTSAATR